MSRVCDSGKNIMLASEEGEDSAVKCRERRRRRMAMRRMAVRGGGNQAQKCAAKATTMNDNPTSSTAQPAIMDLICNMETLPPPVYGMVSVIGRPRQMVDEVSVRTNLCRPEINGFQPVHFFGVFDGHVSTLCKEHMHEIMKEELMRVKVGHESNAGDEVWRLAVNQSFQRMDEVAMKRCGSSICRCNPQLSSMGLTMVVSILTKECMVVANCGDSRAVVCREGLPVALSVKHKADGGGCGGRIMSRPKDDVGFWATAEPEILITKREARDECLILGSNGLWDVISTETACNTVHECLRNLSVEPRNEGIESAATILARLALGRKSADNISVIVIDLRK